MSYADFVNELTVWDTIIFANRESTRHQKLNHDAKEVLLQAVYNQLDLNDLFVMQRFNGSGRLCCINDRTGYYPDLKQTIRDGLARTPIGNKLYLLFTTRSRLLRPPHYDHNNQRATWGHSAEDYEGFDQWIRNNFGARIDDIKFVILFHWLTPDEERSFETQSGQFYQQCLDGIGKRLGRKASSTFRQVAIGLRRQGVSTSEILRRLELEYQDAKLPAAKTVRDWLLQEGLSEPRGRRWYKTT